MCLITQSPATTAIASSLDPAWRTDCPWWQRLIFLGISLESVCTACFRLDSSRAFESYLPLAFFRPVATLALGSGGAAATRQALRGTQRGNLRKRSDPSRRARASYIVESTVSPGFDLLLITNNALLLVDTSDNLVTLGCM